MRRVETNALLPTLYPLRNVLAVRSNTEALYPNKVEMWVVLNVPNAIPFIELTVILLIVVAAPSVDGDIDSIYATEKEDNPRFNANPLTVSIVISVKATLCA